MKIFSNRLFLACLVALPLAGRSLATDNTPVLATPGKLLFEDDFSRTEVQPKWKPGLGKWSVQDGVLVADEDPKDHHGAFAFATPGFEYKDMVADFSFKLDGSKACELRLDDRNYKGSHSGHIARVSITPVSVFLGDSKYGSMEVGFYAKYNDPKATPEEKKALSATIKDKSATFKNTLDVSQWHQARVEVVGEEMVLSIDGKVVGYFKSAGIGHPAKSMLGFTVLGQTTRIDNVKVWDAVSSPGWAAKRAEVLAALGVKP